MPGPGSFHRAFASMPARLVVAVPLYDDEAARRSGCDAWGLTQCGSCALDEARHFWVCGSYWSLRSAARSSTTTFKPELGDDGHRSLDRTQPMFHRF